MAASSRLRIMTGLTITSRLLGTLPHSASPCSRSTDRAFRLCSNELEFADFSENRVKTWQSSADPGTIHGRLHARRNDLRAGRWIRSIRLPPFPSARMRIGKVAGFFARRNALGLMRRDWRNVLLALALFLAGTSRCGCAPRRSKMIGGGPSDVVRLTVEVTWGTSKPEMRRV